MYRSHTSGYLSDPWPHSPPYIEKEKLVRCLAKQKSYSLSIIANAKYKIARSLSLEPWFPQHLQRDTYLSLLHLEQKEPGKEKPITVPDSVLKAALLRRATEDIHRIIAIRSSKQALSTLLARGSVGDDLWQRFLRAEKEVEEELRDVVQEVSITQLGIYPPLWTNSICLFGTHT